MTKSDQRQTRLAILTSHPIQYYAPLFRRLAQSIDLHVFYAHRTEDVSQAAAGYRETFTWDTDLLSGYEHSFLKNVARKPATSQYFGCDTREIGLKLTEGRFTHVLSLGWHLKSLQQGILAAKRAGLIVLVRGDSQLLTPRSTLKKLVKAIAYPALLRVFDAALYVGTLNYEYYRHYHYPDERLFFAPHAVDTEHFSAGSSLASRQALRSELGIAESTFVVLFVGRLVDFKRPLHVIEAVAELRSRQVDAIVMAAGSGVLDQSMVQRANELAVPMQLRGVVNQSELPATYAAADVLMLPSTGNETWGLVCNEALAAGKPILVADSVGCSRNLAMDGVAGRIYPSGKIQIAADQLMQVRISPPDSATIQNLSDRYSLAAAAKGVLEAVLATQSSRQDSDQ